eukprot:6012098-Amphidinium_carterae.1
MVVFSAFVSTLTQSLLHLQTINSQKWKQKDMVRRFLLETSVMKPCDCYERGRVITIVICTGFDQ